MLMRSRRYALLFFAMLICGAGGPSALWAQNITMTARKGNPYSVPRPVANAVNVPINTTYYFQFSDASASDPLDTRTFIIQLKTGPDRKLVRDLVSKGVAGKGCNLSYVGKNPYYESEITSLYITTDFKLLPDTKYYTEVFASSVSGKTLPKGHEIWSWHTEPKPQKHEVMAEISCAPKSGTAPWQGEFFSGLCIPAFCYSDWWGRTPTWELMQKSRESGFPNSWTIKRDFWATGFEYRSGGIFPGFMPNVVRELETRRIKEMRTAGAETTLVVEDFWGHEQYGISSNRSVAGDYQPGDVVIITDGEKSSTATLVQVFDESASSHTLIVKGLSTPEDGWKLEYNKPLPTEENPKVPGLFADGGCYVIKHTPAGNPRYYWGRLDKEFDITVQHGMRVHVGFVDAPGDVSATGRNGYWAKDNVELHKAIYDMTAHIVDRYGDKSLDFYWSIFNEPDILTHFREDWTEFQRFYDYASDAVLRAFEDKGYDSNKVIIGGLELGIVWGIHPQGEKFLSHCAPGDNAIEGELVKNACYGDPRMEGKRSKRMTTLCEANGGTGAPCDFISIHTYGRSANGVTKLTDSKRRALEIDPVFYDKLWVCSFESCPDWSSPGNDLAVRDSYRGNGYFAAWCADFVRGQLAQARKDARYSYGDTILTTWAFNGLNDVVREFSVDDDGDGNAYRKEVLPEQVFNYLNLLSNMRPPYQVLNEQKLGGYSVSGFGSATSESVRICLYAHSDDDYQARSERKFRYALSLKDIPENWTKLRIREYRFDKQHNGIYNLLREGRIAKEGRSSLSPKLFAEVRDASSLQVTREKTLKRKAAGRLNWSTEVQSNGVSFIQIERADD